MTHFHQRQNEPYMQFYPEDFKVTPHSLKEMQSTNIPLISKDMCSTLEKKACSIFFKAKSMNRSIQSIVVTNFNKVVRVRSSFTAVRRSIQEFVVIDMLFLLVLW